MIVLDRLPGFSAFLLVGLMKIRTVVPDFQASGPQLTGFLASTMELQKNKDMSSPEPEWLNGILCKYMD